MFLWLSLWHCYFMAFIIILKEPGFVLSLTSMINITYELNFKISSSKLLMPTSKKGVFWLIDCSRLSNSSEMNNKKTDSAFSRKLDFYFAVIWCEWWVVCLTYMRNCYHHHTSKREKRSNSHSYFTSGMSVHPKDSRDCSVQEMVEG